jgi:hypothetical protein
LQGESVILCRATLFVTSNHYFQYQKGFITAPVFYLPFGGATYEGRVHQWLSLLASSIGKIVELSQQEPRIFWRHLHLPIGCSQQHYRADIHLGSELVDILFRSEALYTAGRKHS